eukprot:3972442-Prymnesium_polylepis.1
MAGRAARSERLAAAAAATDGAGRGVASACARRRRRRRRALALSGRAASHSRSVGDGRPGARVDAARGRRVLPPPRGRPADRLGRGGAAARRRAARDERG